MSEPPDAAPAPAPPARGFKPAPASQWLRGCNAASLRSDAAAGVTLAAYMLPAALGDATLAGLPPQAGLYACLFSGLVYWIFCSSRHTAVSVTSAISLLVGSSLGPLAGGDPARFAALAAATALLAALIAFVARLARAGSAVHFISESVLLGFKAGVALHLASTQLPKLFGVPGGHGDFWDRIFEFLKHVHATHPASLLTGCTALALLILGKWLLPNRPVALFVVIGGIVAAGLLDLGSRGVHLLGLVPGGLPVPGIPHVTPADLRELLPLALACFLLGAVETAAIGRMFAAKHNVRFDNNQELVALAGANLAAGLTQGFPVSGGMSQSLVNESAGARTPASGLIASVLLLLVALFFTGLLRTLPQPVLAAVILIAVTSLFKARELLRLFRYHRGEFLVAAGALLAVLAAGLLKGVLVGAVISLVLLLRRASAPHVAFLGRIPGTRRYSDLDRHPGNEPIPGVLAFRVEASILYFNADHVLETVAARVDASPVPPQLVICDLSTSPHVDVSGAQALHALHRQLAARGIVFRTVEAHGAVRDMLRVEGVEAATGRVDRFTTLDAVISGWNGPTPDETPAPDPIS